MYGESTAPLVSGSVMPLYTTRRDFYGPQKRTPIMRAIDAVADALWRVPGVSRLWVWYTHRGRE